MMGMRNANSATLDPNESASLCFSKPGPINYTVRMESTQSTGELNVPGSIHVQEGGRGS
jgi:hypothetical protein